MFFYQEQKQAESVFLSQLHFHRIKDSVEEARLIDDVPLYGYFPNEQFSI